MASTRYLRQAADGSWQLRKDGDRRASVQSTTKQGAIQRARTMVSNEGGGEIRVLNSAGKIKEQITVGRTQEPPNSSTH